MAALDDPKTLGRTRLSFADEADIDEFADTLARFEAGLMRAAAIGEDPARLAQPVTPPIEFPPLAHYTVHDALTHIAQHNSHHLGQIITTRQLLRSWPPPSGSFTW